MTTVWVAERKAVYGQGVVAVFTSRADAERFAAEVRPDADGHHCWRFTEHLLGVAPDPEPGPPASKWGDNFRLTATEYATQERYVAGDEWVPLPAAEDQP